MSLFDKYGGFANISKIVLAFYEEAIDSDVIGPYFDHVDMKRLIDHQTKFIASVMGGPASYTNDALRKVHAPYDIDQSAFQEMSRLLRETLLAFDVQPADVDTVMAEIDARAHLVVSGPGDG